MATRKKKLMMFVCYNDGLQTFYLYTSFIHFWTFFIDNYINRWMRRKWQPTPVFLPGDSQGRGSLVGCRLWGLTESDTTEET